MHRGKPEAGRWSADDCVSRPKGTRMAAIGVKERGGFESPHEGRVDRS